MHFYGKTHLFFFFKAIEKLQSVFPVITSLSEEQSVCVRGLNDQGQAGDGISGVITHKMTR